MTPSPHFQVSSSSRKRGPNRRGLTVLALRARRLSPNNKPLWLWVPAFAGTTRGRWLPPIQVSNSLCCDTASRSRRAFYASFAGIFPSSVFRGRRECRAPDAPDSRVCNGSVQSAHALVRSHRNHPAFPAQWFTAYIALSPVSRAFLPPSPLRSLLLKNLTPASGCQDHTSSPSACSALVFSAAASTASRRPRP